MRSNKVRKESKKVTSMERLGEDVSDLVLCLDVLESGVTVVDDVADVVILEEHVADTLGVDRVLGLGDAGLVVLEDGSGRGLTDAEFG